VEPTGATPHPVGPPARSAGSPATCADGPCVLSSIAVEMPIALPNRRGLAAAADAERVRPAGSAANAATGGMAGARPPATVAAAALNPRVTPAAAAAAKCITGAGNHAPAPERVPSTGGAPARTRAHQGVPAPATDLGPGSDSGQTAPSFPVGGGFNKTGEGGRACPPHAERNATSLSSRSPEAKSPDTALRPEGKAATAARPPAGKSPATAGPPEGKSPTTAEAHESAAPPSSLALPWADGDAKSSAVVASLERNSLDPSRFDLEAGAVPGLSMILVQHDPKIPCVREVRLLRESSIEKVRARLSLASKERARASTWTGEWQVLRWGKAALRASSESCWREGDQWFLAFRREAGPLRGALLSIVVHEECAAPFGSPTAHHPLSARCDDGGLVSFNGLREFRVACCFAL
jgi:hypothetical protein